MRKPTLSARGWSLVLAAAIASAITVPLAISLSHREAPNIMLDPSADNTDVYAFTAPDAEDAITIVSNWIPGQCRQTGRTSSGSTIGPVTTTTSTTTATVAPTS